MKIKLPEGRGFDIVVWQKAKAADVFCASYSPSGTLYLKEWFPDARTRTIYEMGIIHPKEFLQQATKGLKIGGISPGAKVPMLINPPLH